MQLPPHTDVSIEMLSALAAHHGLPPHAITRLPDAGIFNAIYAIGEDLILRVPRRHPAHYTALHNESIVVPLARKAGVHTPSLLVYDDSCHLLPVPYTVYERVHGKTLGSINLEPSDVPDIWRALGRDLARLHTGVDRARTGTALGERELLPDPRELAEELAL